MDAVLKEVLIMIKSAEVVIIGGGITGVAIAYNLAKKGVKNIALN